MQMYTDEALEGWGDLFVKHGLFEAGVTSGRCDGADNTRSRGVPHPSLGM